jgi:hypothetical protein
MGAAFVSSYLTTLGAGQLVPEKDEQTSALLDFYLLDKCLYELDYEFNNRPDWVSIPLLGLLGLLEQNQMAADPGAAPEEKELPSDVNHRVPESREFEPKSARGGR